MFKRYLICIKCGYKAKRWFFTENYDKEMAETPSFCSICWKLGEHNRMVFEDEV